VNLNKLFPRLTIRWKLTIAFVLLAGVPVVLVSGFATRVKIEHLRATAATGLEYDLALARSQMERALREAEENVAYVASTLLADVLESPTPSKLPAAAAAVAAFMEHKSSLYQIKLIAEDGTLLLTARAAGAVPAAVDGQPSGMYYAYRARLLDPGAQLLLPVELSGRDAGTDGTIPAVAILMPLQDAAGSFAGALAGEAYASALFAELETGSPHIPGVTGLVDQDGFFLYHSERKSDWGHLLATRAMVDLQREFSPELAARITAGGAGALSARRQLVSYAPLSLDSYGTGPLYLYRAVALSTLEAPVRAFMRWVGGAGLLLGGCVLGLAVVAANQFTRPIYRLRSGMRELAAGGMPAPLGVVTNDELEDLSTEFMETATTLTTYRHRLQELVAERTRALHETYGELAAVLDHSADAIIGLDAAGRIRVWNRGAESLFGYPAAAVVGRRADALLRVPGADAQHEAVFLRRRLDEDGVVVDFRTERAARGGGVVSVSLTQSVIRGAAGERAGYSLILRDATLQAKLEAQMRRSERLAAASVMAAALAHEVNNPLGIIGNRIECMEREVRTYCEGCRLEQDLSVLREHTERLMGVTRDLLSLASDGTDAHGVVELDELVERVARLAEHTFSARAVRLEVRRTGADLAPFMGSESALETVCLNLLLNAADATPAGGTVWLETRSARDGAELELEVGDTGPGVPPALRERIFEPFFTTKGPRGGTGLGLAVCRTVIERHGGRIRVEAGAAGGSRFVVALPVCAAVPA
jgi:PAS domain S-box-containing protein